MRKNHTQPLAEVIQEYIKALGIENKLKEVKLIKQWENVIGKNVANATKKIYINNQILYVYLNSSVIRHELSMLKQGIIIALNEKAGEKLIHDIVFL